MSMKNVLTKIIVVLLGCLMLLPFSAEAAKKVKKPMRDVNFFQTQRLQENGREIMRIEIGLSKSKAEFEVKPNPKKSKQLVVEIPYARLNGDIPEDVTLDGKLSRYMTLREKKINKVKTVQIMVAMTKEFTDNCFRVYTMPSDKKKGKPYRLVIDVSNTRFRMGLGTVDGVKGRTIVIDPGHGGLDTGARGSTGLLEKDVNLMVGLRVRDIIEASGGKCVMTHDEDVDVFGADARNATDADELQARVDVGTYTPNAEIFVSIHCNAAYNPTGNGTETYYYPKTGYDMMLAERIQEELVEYGGRRDRGVKQARFYVLRHGYIPAALAELAFISNFEEEPLLWSDDFQDKVAYAVANGIGRFFLETDYRK